LLDMAKVRAWYALTADVVDTDAKDASERGYRRGCSVGQRGECRFGCESGADAEAATVGTGLTVLY